MRRTLIALFCAMVMVVGVVSPAGADIGEPEGVGLHDPSTGIWSLLKGDGQQTSFYFGDPNDYGFLGDWNCNGEDTPGLYRQQDGYVYLRNSNTQGIADIRFFFGNPGDVPLAGDFNGDGCDTVSIWRPSENRVYIINKLGSGDQGLGFAEFDYSIGKRGDEPFVGDFDGDGKDSVGVYDLNTGRVSIHNKQAAGAPDTSFLYGRPGADTVIASDWDGNGTDTIGIYRAESQYHSGGGFFLRNSNSAGPADIVVPGGVGGLRPVAGVFQDLGPGLPPPIPPPNYPTVAQVLSGEAYGDVIMRGAVVGTTSDSDEFWFSDGTGRIVIDLNTTRLNPADVVFNVCYFIEGRARSNEIDVSNMARC